MALALIGMLAVVGVRLVHDGRILPGVHVGGVALGGADATSARNALTRLTRRPVVIGADGQRLRVDAAAAGRTVDLDATVDRAMRAGRDGRAGGLWSTATALAGARHDVPLVATVDTRRLRTAVGRLASRVDRPPFHGSVAVAPGTLEVSTRTPRPGRTVDRVALVRRLQRALLRGETELRAQTRARPAASAASVVAAGRAAARYVRVPLQLRVGGASVTVGSDRLASVLGVDLAQDARKVVLGSRAEGVSSLVREIAAARDRAARQPRFRAPRMAVAVEGKADVSWRPRRARIAVDDGQRGRRVDQHGAAAAIASAIRSGRHAAVLPVHDLAPRISAAQARRVRFLIGAFTTRYEPGQPRVMNIRRIARAVDGTVIAPGATFSLNAIAGPRTRAKGYVEAPFIADGEIVPSVGGGVSQFSTTLYNAAYFAGLRLDRHQPHSLFIDRYPPGRESTLNFPDIDLRWTNDTAAPVVVRAATDSTSVTVSLYGDNGGRRVRAVTGERRRAAGRDFAITVTRVIRYPGGRVLRQPYMTTYDRPSDDE